MHIPSAQSHARPLPRSCGRPQAPWRHLGPVAVRAPHPTNGCVRPEAPRRQRWPIAAQAPRTLIGPTRMLIYISPCFGVPLSLKVGPMGVTAHIRSPKT